MLLYSLTGATALNDPEYGHFEPGPDGGFEVADDLADRLVRFHHRGRPLWETQIDRGRRVAAEDLERRRDPANLLEAVQQILAAAQLATTVTAQAQAQAADSTATTAEAKAPRGRGAKRATTGDAAPELPAGPAE